LYVRRGSNPTAMDFDYRDVSSEISEVTIQNPGLSTWFVGVYGYKECTYLLSAELTKECPDNCTDEQHGICERGHCQCKEDWISRDCSVKSTLLTNGGIESGSVKSGGWKFYRFAAIPGSKITIVLSEQNSVGVLRMYESLQGVPTLSGFDYSDTDTNSAVHRIRMEVQDSTNLTIGVYGSILGSPNIDYSYQLVVWQSRFDA